MAKLEFQYTYKTICSNAFCTYPLKFLFPNGILPPAFDGVVVYLIGYGGGFVSGDTVCIDVDLHENATAILCTQASTKIYKMAKYMETSTQIVHLHVKENATLVYVPDPIVCYEDSRYQQELSINASDRSNIVLVDWMTGGRKRLVSSLNDIERNEAWKFNLYDSSNQLFIHDKPILIDRILLQDNQPFTMQERMHNTQVIGMLVIVGSRFQSMSAGILDLGKRKLLCAAQQDPVPYGSLKNNDIMEHNIHYSTSAIADGVLVRFSAADTESAYQFLKSILNPLHSIIGYSVYSHC